MKTTRFDAAVRMLVQVGYADDAIKRALAEQFPNRTGEQIDAAVVKAHESVAAREREFDAAIADDERRAREAEQDLSKTMHEGGAHER